MQIHRRLTLLLALSPAIIPAFLHAQAPGPPPPAPDPPPKSLGNYSLVVALQEPSAATHLLNPPILIDIEAATALAPKDATGTRPVPPQFSADSFGNPRYDCIPKVAPTSAKDNACEALDRTEITLRDPNTVAYHLANHGPAAQLQLNLQVHDIEPVSRAEMQGSWHAAEVIFVAVPKSTPALKVVSATLIGDWDGNAIVFEPGKPLPDTAKKALEDLDIHQDLGDKTLYSYKVKDPKADPKPSK